jgi:hypothetical protein
MVSLKTLVPVALLALGCLAPIARSQVLVGPTDTLPSGMPLLVPSIINSPSQGGLFFATMGNINTYAEVANDSGRPLFYIHAPSSLLDFKVQPNGMITYYSTSAAGYVVLDARYNKITTVQCQGYPTDNHDFRILPNGNYLLFGFDSLMNYDISGIVGSPKVVSAVGVVIQELDPNQNVVWQWRGWDEGNFVPEDMQHPETVTKDDMDAIHANAIDVDDDGNVILSSRHLSEVTKISRTTGHIIWRMGGKNNEFTFIDDSLGFSYQHCVRFLPPNHLLLFDNGNYHTPAFSRAVEYEVNDAAKTAKQVWSFEHDRSIYCPFMGSVQRLSNGNTLIGWGGAATPTVTEVRPDGEVAYEATISTKQLSYRVFRFPWTIASVPSSSIAGLSMSSLSPNPAQSLSTLSLISDRPRALSVSVYDMNGRLMETICNETIGAGVSLYELHPASWPHGAYRVVLKGSEGIMVQNFIH